MQKVSAIIASRRPEIFEPALAALRAKLPGVEFDLAGEPSELLGKAVCQDHAVIFLDLPHLEPERKWLEAARFVGGLNRQRDISIVALTPCVRADAWRQLRNMNISDVVAWRDGCPNVQDLSDATTEAIFWQKSRRASFEEIKTLAANSGLVTQSRAMHDAVHRAWRGVQSAGPLLIRGRPGIGKTHLARALLAEVPRRPVARFDGAALAKFIEKRRGSVLDALVAAFVQAGGAEVLNGGLVFIDEVALLPVEVQSSLAWLIQQDAYPSPDTGRDLSVRFKLIYTTGADLELLVQAGKFREELCHVASCVTIPPLAERRDDIVPIAKQILSRSRPDLKLDVFVESIFRGYNWPGESAELEAVLTQAAPPVPMGSSLEHWNLPKDFQARWSTHCAEKFGRPSHSSHSRVRPPVEPVAIRKPWARWFKFS